MQCCHVFGVTEFDDNTSDESNLIEVKVRPPDGFLLRHNLEETNHGDRTEVRTLVSISEELNVVNSTAKLVKDPDHKIPEVVMQEVYMHDPHKGVVVSIRKSDDDANKYVIKKKRKVNVIPTEEDIFVPTPLPLTTEVIKTETGLDETTEDAEDEKEPRALFSPDKDIGETTEKIIHKSRPLRRRPIALPLVDLLAEEVHKDTTEKLVIEDTKGTTDTEETNYNLPLVEVLKETTKEPDIKDIADTTDVEDINYKSRSLRIFPYKRKVITRPRKATVIVKPIRPQAPSKVRLFYGNKRRRQIKPQPLKIKDSVHEYVLKVAQADAAFNPHPHLDGNPLETRQVPVDHQPSNFLSNFNGEYGTKLNSHYFVTSRPLKVNYAGDDDIWHPIVVTTPKSVVTTSRKDLFSDLKNDNIANLLVEDPYANYDTFDERQFVKDSYEEASQPGPPYYGHAENFPYFQPQSFFNEEFFRSDYGPSKRSRSLSVSDDSVQFGASTGYNGAFEWYSDHPNYQKK